MDKSPDAFRTISEAAEELNVPQHVLRFWETRFAQIKPMKRAGGRRYYRPADVELLKGIRSLLYGEGYTIRGVQRILKEEGPNFVCGVGRGEVAARKSELPGDKEGAAGTPPPPGKAPLARLPEKVGSGLSDAQQQSLNQALKELGEAKGLLEPGS
ncbi:MAG: MerR family transcriptional regulator [Aestuariivirga sp.]